MRSLGGVASLCTAFVFLVGGIAGCVEAPRSEPVGYVSLSLTAVGASGATYHMPEASLLQLTGSTFGGFYDLDVNGDLLTIEVPPGEYEPFVLDLDDDPTTTSLTRDNPDGTTDTVPATLDLPSTITVTEDHTTPLVLRFRLVTGDQVTFAQGTVVISVEVDETSELEVDMSAQLGVQQVLFDNTTPDALRLRLPGAGDTGDSYHVHLRTAGKWAELSPDLVCISVAASVEATGHIGFVNLVEEAPPSGSGNLCIQQVAEGLAFVRTGFGREGAAQTALLSDFDNAPYIISHDISMFVPGVIFDGKTLHLDALKGTHDFNTNVFATIFATVPSPRGPRVRSWYQLNESTFDAPPGRLVVTSN